MNDSRQFFSPTNYYRWYMRFSIGDIVSRLDYFGATKYYYIVIDLSTSKEHYLLKSIEDSKQYTAHHQYIDQTYYLESTIWDSLLVKSLRTGKINTSLLLISRVSLKILIMCCILLRRMIDILSQHYLLNNIIREKNDYCFRDRWYGWSNKNLRHL